MESTILKKSRKNLLSYLSLRSFIRTDREMEKLISKSVMPDICSDQPDYNASIYNIWKKEI